MKIIFTLFFFCSIPFFAFSQVEGTQKELNKDGSIIYLKFNDDKQKKPLSEAATLLKDSLKIRNGNNLILSESKRDKLGYIHQYYNQYYKGVRIEYGKYAVHAKNDKIELIAGNYQEVYDVNITPKLTPQAALSSALKLIGAKKYKWENAEEERLLKTITGKKDTSYYPKGEIIIIKDLLQTNNQYRLAFRFQIYSEVPLSHKTYYIDALNGSLLYAEDLIKHLNAPGTADTRYSGTQTFVSDSFTGGFRLREVRNGVNVQTFNMNMGANYGAATDFVDTDNNWTNAEHNNTALDNAALDAHWGTERVYDYFLNVHGRNSWNGSGGVLLNYVHANLVAMGYPNNDNAFWDGQRMTYGDGSTMFSPLTSLDVVAHEIGHGVMEFSANLAYNGESGALNKDLAISGQHVLKHRQLPGNKDGLSERISPSREYL